MKKVCLTSGPDPFPVRFSRKNVAVLFGSDSFFLEKY